MPYLTPKPRKTSQKTPKFSANKKWAVSPLISPPAGEITATQADKLVCILSIGQNALDFNEKERKYKTPPTACSCGRSCRKNKKEGECRRPDKNMPEKTSSYRDALPTGMIPPKGKESGQNALE
ncbi:MAG TPA: hypothetical protein VGF01_14915 [Terracidiphilus sp.]